MITVEKAKKLRAIIERAVAALELDNEAALECVELSGMGERQGVHRRDEGTVRRKALSLRASAHVAKRLDSAGRRLSLERRNGRPGNRVRRMETADRRSRRIQKGDRVLFNGSVYESLIDGNAYSPTAYPAGWKLIE